MFEISVNPPPACGTLGMLRMGRRKRPRWGTSSWLIDGILVRDGALYFGTPIGTPHKFGLSSSLSRLFSSVVKPK